MKQKIFLEFIVRDVFFGYSGFLPFSSVNGFTQNKLESDLSFVKDSICELDRAVQVVVFRLKQYTVISSPITASLA